MIPEWLLILSCIVMWLAGFLTFGVIIGRTPFWDGVRDGFGFRWWRK